MALDLVNIHHDIHAVAVTALAYLVLGHVLVLSVQSVDLVVNCWVNVAQRGLREVLHD